MRNKELNIKGVLSSKVVSVCILAVFGFSLVALGKVMARHYKINQEIAGMEEEAELLQRDSIRLARLIEYSDTRSFREKEARLKLGMKKEGEKVVVIVPPDEAGLQEELPEEWDLSGKDVPNYAKWKEYFFGN